MNMRKSLVSIFLCVSFLIILSVGTIGAYADNTTNKSENTITVDGVSLSVHTLYKSGKDNENFIILFLGDGYTASEQNAFVSYAEKCAKTLISTEPFRSFWDKINIYAVPTVSNVSGTSGDGYPVDTYLGVKYGSTIGFDSARNGRKKADAIKNELENKFLDSGAEILKVHVVSNAEINLGGAAVTGNTRYSFSTLNTMYSNGEPTVHELAHSIGKLSDEYGYYRAGANTYNANDPESVPWKKMMGFNGTGIVPNGNAGEGATEICYIPTLSCIMKDTGNGAFCEVCKFELVGRMNQALSYPNRLGEYYIAVPQITIAKSGSAYERVVVGDGNITKANGQDVEFRTIVQNLENKVLNLKLQFEISNGDGDIKYSAEKEVTIPQMDNVYNYEEVTQSISVVIENVSGLKNGDKLSGRVIHMDTDTVIMTDKSVGGGKMKTKTLVSGNNKTFNIKANKIPEGSNVILAMYNGDTLCDVKTFVYDGSDMSYTTNKNVTAAKVMTWKDISSIQPVCPTEKITF